MILSSFVRCTARLGACTDEEKVRVALGSISVNTSVIPVGHQYGMFAKYGVDLEPIYMGGGMNSLAAVTSNSVQFLSAGSTATISARFGRHRHRHVDRSVEQIRLFSSSPLRKSSRPRISKGKSSPELVRAPRRTALCDCICAERGWCRIRMSSLFPWGIANRDA